VKKEELSQAGVDIEEKDYLSVILSSLPFALSNFASSILASSYVSSNKVTPDDLMSMLMEESDRQRAQRSRGKGSGKGKEEENEALAVRESAKGKKGKGKSKHADLKCYNCEKMGHISRFCKEPKKPRTKDDSGKEKHGDGNRSGSGTANTVESSKEVEEDGAWVVEAELDWFEEVIEEMEGMGWANVVEEFNDTSREAFVTEVAGTDRVAELYDSGCMNHISPYRTKFENFTTSLRSCFVQLTNKRSAP
jgi:hypothetical protein